MTICDYFKIVKDTRVRTMLDDHLISHFVPYDNETYPREWQWSAQPLPGVVCLWKQIKRSQTHGIQPLENVFHPFLLKNL